MSTFATVYNQSVKVESTNGNVIDLIKRFLAEYYTVTQMSGGKETTFVDVVYASKITKYNVWYFLTNQYKHLLMYLSERGIDIKEIKYTDERDYNVVPAEFKVKEGWSLRDLQIPVYDFILSHTDGSCLVPLVPGSGKDQPLSSLIKVPGGWSTMGEMKVGTVVTAKDGSATKVTGVFPQGKKPVYELTFADGRTAKAGGEHLWRVYKDGGVSEVVTTLTVKSYLPDGVCIDLCHSEDSREVSLSTRPYFMGLLFDEAWTLPEGKPIASYIPDEYLNGSDSQRFELAQGLMVFGGCVSRSGIISYRTSHPKLAEQVQYLIRSLGGIATLRHVHDKYVVFIEYKNPARLFTNPLKQARCKSNLDLKLKVVSVECVGEEETQCISIEHPSHLYVTDDFIVTHNTAISMLAAAAIKVRMAIIILPTFMEKWASDIDTIHETNIKKELFVIQGSKSICSIVDMARNGELTQNYLIFSSRTMQDFIRMYEEEPENCVEMYGCAPSELFPLLGVGLLLIDETHMAYHAMYKIVTHCNVKYQVGLSATLMSEDNVVKRAHKVMYPTSRVYGDKMQKRYLEVYPISYGLTPDSSKKIRVTNYGSNMYSHTAFERSVMKHGRLLEAYYAIIKETVDMYYIEGYMKDDKLVIFVAMIDMADKLLVRLQRDYPGKKSVRYCQDDAYEDMLKGDIIVTTPGSLGTGIDVPHLRVAIATVSISSPVSNIQMSGRLRELKDRNVKYCYLYSNNIQKHVQHHRKRLETLAGYTKDFVHRRSRYQLG